MATDEYWGTLKAWGLSNPVRVTPRTFSMLDRDMEPCQVPDPALLTQEERAAALDLIKRLHVPLSG
jgi:hypothetical protein